MQKRILAILAGLWSYCIIGVFLLANLLADSPQAYASQTPFSLLMGLLLLSPVLSIWGLAQGLRDWNMASFGLAVKLVHIPFYLLISCLFLILPLGAVFYFFFDVLALGISSSLGIGSILRAKKEGLLSTGVAVLHVILHCFFLTDVISAFVVRKHLH
jgi:hypothetical protein